jgi:photosystem II stability/assembly factor-like uncharacterized protein
MSMYDELVGWAVGSEYSVAYTRDGGATWRRIVHGPPDADAAITYRDVWALGADTLVAVGDGNRVLRSR